VIHARFRSSDVDQEECWLEQKQAEGEVPTGFCHESVVRLLASADRASSASKRLQQALEAGVDKSGNCFGSVVAAYIHTSDLEEAERWLAVMEEYGLATNHRGKHHSAEALQL